MGRPIAGFALTVSLASLAAAVVAASPAGAARTPISGAIGKPGYTLIALAYNGKATAVRSARGRFRLRPPAKWVTLHLRAPSGSYAGPLVLGKRGRNRVIVGVRHGAGLGRVKVRRGFATLARRPGRRFVDRRRLARARRGRPLGARGFGLVRSRARGRKGGGQDQDLDGVPNVFDVDNDGDLVLDNVDRRSSRQASAAQQPPPPTCPDPPQMGQPSECSGKNGFWTSAQFYVPIEKSVNANAGTTGQVDAAMEQHLFLITERVRGDTVELNCGGAVPAGLPYCAPGGTGVAQDPRTFRQEPFPSCCDPDGDGLGSLPLSDEFQLFPHAPPSKVKAGDALIQHSTTGAVERQVPGVLNFVFNTTPALVSWQDNHGNSGQVTYPVPEDGTGTERDPFTVGGGPGDVVVTMTWWRPQRSAIPGSDPTSGFLDVGGLDWGFFVRSPRNPMPSGPQPPGSPPPSGGDDPLGTCDPSTLSTPDSNLEVAQHGLRDTSRDAPSTPGRTLTFSVNLTKCLAGANDRQQVASWHPGQIMSVEVQASTQLADKAGQGFYFKLR